MAKRFKLKFSRVIAAVRLCRSKKPSKLPETTVPVIRMLSPVNPKALEIGYPNLNFPAPPPSTPDYSFIRRHLSPKVASVGCGCRARSWSIQYLSPDVSFESADYSWKKEATRLQIAAKAHSSKHQRKTYEASFSDERNADIAPIFVGKYKDNRKEKKMEKVKAIASVSSRDSVYFSSELGAEDEETETLIFTSRSFSDDSSFELDQLPAEDSHMETKRNKKKANSKKLKRLRSFGSKISRTKAGALSSTENETPWRGSMSKRSMTPPSTEGKVRESVAVVKKSEDPYEDFKRSMLEMIMEKQMFEAKDLEQLLQSFLSLNSRQHHETIVEAFTEIWEALFCDYPMNVL